MNALTLTPGSLTLKQLRNVWRQPVTLSLDGGEPVDAGSALMIMTLGAGNGAQVTVASEDEAVCHQIAELVQQDLDA